MENAFDNLTEAIRNATEIDRVVRSQSNNMIDILEGRLESVTPGRLKRLKAKLARFNAVTGEWKL